LLQFAACLPIYRTTEGRFVAIAGELSESVQGTLGSNQGTFGNIPGTVKHYVCPPHVFQPPPDTPLLEHVPAASLLYKALGVEELTDSAVMVHFVLPQFERYTCLTLSMNDTLTISIVLFHCTCAVRVSRRPACLADPHDSGVVAFRSAANISQESLSTARLREDLFAE
jgi:hypothetical protein